MIKKNRLLSISAFFGVVVFLFFFTTSLNAVTPKPVVIGFDGEYGLKNSTSAQNIEMGLKIAIEEVNRSGGVLGGRPLKLITRDNRSVPARGVHNIKIFSEIEDLVAVIGGRFSPVILSAIPVIHEKKIVLFDAWGSADGITSHTYRPSYSFRVSLRDAYAMPTMIKHAQKKGAKRLGIMVPNTGWGRSNDLAAKRYIQKSGAKLETKVIWYNWGDKSFTSSYESLLNWGAEALVMVANDIEGSLIVREVAKYPKSKRLPIISHWGVTGGHFVKACQGDLKKVDFSVVQTFSLFKANPKRVKSVMTLAKGMFKISRIEDIESPVGFGHSYDIVHILALAIDKAGSTDRQAIRSALEKIKSYNGLVKDYNNPFGPEDHDALELQDVFMATYDENGVIRPL